MCSKLLLLLCLHCCCHGWATACGYVAASNPASSTISDKVDAMWIFGFSTSTDPYGISFK
jgi:hypothetical protein